MYILFITGACGSLDCAIEFSQVFTIERLNSPPLGLYSRYTSCFEILLFGKLPNAFHPWLVASFSIINGHGLVNISPLNIYLLSTTLW